MGVPEIFQYQFMQNAFAAGILVGIICPAVGLFITLRRLSLIADALSHVCLSGVAAGLLMGTHPVATASAFSLGGAVLIEIMREKFRHYSELSIAVVLSAGVALGAVLLGLGQGLGANFVSYLFGSIVTIDSTDIKIIISVGLPVLALVTVLYNELFLITFDEEGARVAGLPVRAITVGFTALTALTIAISIRIVGILLVSSLMILPVAAALKLAKSFRGALVWSVAAGEAAVLAGLFVSYYLDLPPGGTIILVSVALLVGVLLIKGSRPAPAPAADSID